MIRLRGQTKHYKQIIFSFNPVSITHWLKSEFFDVSKEDATTSHTTYKDNKFLDAEAIKVLEDFKDTDPYYYMVYCLGQWGVLGKTVFDGQKVSNRIVYLREHDKCRKGRFERKDGKVSFESDINGDWTLYKIPEVNQRFVAGIDVAEGNEWGDYNATHFIDTVNYEQYCVYHGHCDLDIYAEELCKAGEYFNWALLTPEVNFNPGLVLNLQRFDYPKIYLRQVTDSITHDIKKKYGFRTDKYNRQGIITDLVEFVRDHVDNINDIATLEEMLTFVRDEKGKPQAQKGKHDDLVMALAIALHAVISGQGGTYSEEKKFDISKLPIDCQEDYYNAAKHDRERLLKRWGY